MNLSGNSIEHVGIFVPRHRCVLLLPFVYRQGISLKSPHHPLILRVCNTWSLNVNVTVCNTCDGLFLVKGGKSSQRKLALNEACTTPPVRSHGLALQVLHGAWGALDSRRQTPFFPGIPEPSGTCLRRAGSPPAHFPKAPALQGRGGCAAPAVRNPPPRILQYPCTPQREAWGGP